MSEAHQETYQDSSTPSILHPLEPLVAEEIAAAVRILRTEKELGESIRFVSVNLNEPAKEIVLHYKPGEPITREAFIVLFRRHQSPVFRFAMHMCGKKELAEEVTQEVFLQPSHELYPPFGGSSQLAHSLSQTRPRAKWGELPTGASPPSG